MFRFSDETAFSGLSFFALTPEAAKKCKVRTYDRGICVYDSSWFDRLNKVLLGSLGVSDLMELVDLIAAAHARTYNWESGADLEL